MANKKQTSKSVATTASNILRDGRYGKNSKSVAGSALSQTRTARKNNLAQVGGIRSTPTYFHHSQTAPPYLHP